MADHVRAYAQVAQAQQAEPVAFGMRDKTTGLILDVICPDEHESYGGEYTIPLYEHPPKAEAKPLTEQRIWDAVEHGVVGGIGMPSKAIAVARVIEAACAEAWGVKLAGIGASSGGKP